MDKERSKNLEGLFKGANLSGAQIIAVNEGEVYYQKYSGTPTATKTEEDIKKAVMRLMDEKDETGNYLMHDQDQFFAIKTVLTQLCGFPVKPADFGKTMHNLELDGLRIKYDNESVRKVHLHQLPQNVTLWHQYKNTTDLYSMKQVKVAIRLIEFLEMDGC